MELTHTFTVPLGVEETWAHFNDIESVAECFPGATVTEVDGDSFAGSCKVKLGPIALVYNGSGTLRGEGRGRRTGSSSTPRARTSAATAPPAPTSR